MAEHGAQYDHIGSKYDEYTQTAPLKWAECYTFFRMVGGLEGKRVLDVACGVGFYTRLLKQRGAAQVLGVDISPEMIRLADQQEQAEPSASCIRSATRSPCPGWAPLIWSRRSISSPTRPARTSCWACSGASTPT